MEEISLAGGGSFSTTDGQRGDFRLAAERVLPSNHLVEHRAEREDIATRIERFAFDLFRRQVRNGAEDDAFFTDHLFHSQGARRFFCAHSVDGGGRGQFRQAEVQHLRAAVRIHHDVGGLQIPVHDAGAVRGGECVGHLRRDAQRFGEPHALARDQLIQRLAIHQLHDDVGLPVLLADFMDGDDVGVVQRRSRFGLLHEARAAVGIGTAHFSQQFDGDETIQALVPGLVDPTHAALADLFQQGEMPQLAAVHIRSIVVFQLVSGVREAIALGSRRIRKLC